jgi:hypothetical protein
VLAQPKMLDAVSTPVGACSVHSLGRRAELIGPQTAAPVAAGEVIFGDPDSRFTGLLDLLLDTIGRLRPIRP